MKLVFVIMLSFYLLLFQPSVFYSQANNKIDSLINQLKQCENDSTQISLLIQLGGQYNSIDREIAENYAKQAIELSQELGNIEQLANSYKLLGFIEMVYNDMYPAIENLQKCVDITLTLNDSESNRAFAYQYLGYSYEELGKYDSALHYFEQSLYLFEELDNTAQIAESYRHLGGLKWLQGDFTSASEYLEKSLPLYDEMTYLTGKAYALNNIAILHFEMEKYDKALDFYNEAYEIFKENNNDDGRSMILLNTGEILWKKKEYKTALNYYFRSLELAEKLVNKTNIGYNLTNIGIVFFEMKDYKKAADYYDKAMLIWEGIDNKTGLTYCLNYIGILEFEIGQYQRAIKSTLHCLKVGKEIGSLDEIRRSYETLSKAYARIGVYKVAYNYHILFKELNDSIFNKESASRLTALESRYKLDKQKQMIAVQQTQLELQDVRLKQQKMLRNLLIGSLFAVLIVVILIAYAYIQKRKHNQRILKQKEEIQAINIELRQQKEEIEAQRDEIEAQRDTVLEQKNHIEKINKEVTDSINYAQYIQYAILPQPELRDQLFGEHFIFFKPRDIVSGDFYWVTKIEGRTIIAVADCTGHGVPGAFMSMLGLSYLNEIINNEYITHPGVILRRLRKKVIRALQQKGELGEQRDGMDISLCSIDYDTLKLEFSGANNPVYILRNRNYEPILNARILESDEYILYEIKGDKMPIAMYDKMDKFQIHEIQLQKGDCIYLFSDGYADQFGGPEGKKFKYKPFKKLLLSNCQKTMGEQQLILDKTLSIWQQKYEQVDDIVVVGIKI
ncbi:MAG: tetratricopeptide repeat protein [Bacteroidales bacterium]|nr:tetratricopeptide repeat protein [Bacteroidales bacterium]